MDLCFFKFADGVTFGIGTIAELAQLKAEGVAPVDATAQALTEQDVEAILSPEYDRIAA